MGTLSMDDIFRKYGDYLFNANRVIILYEDTEFKVFCTPEVFFKTQGERMDKLRNMDNETQLLKIVKHEISGKNHEIYLPKILKTRFVQLRFEFLLADFLEGGVCICYNKISNSFINQIKVEARSFQAGPLCGGGRSFYLNNTLIHEVEDWIS